MSIKEFEHGNPKDEYQKSMLELINDLDAIAMIFIKEKKDKIPEMLHNIVVSGLIGYAAKMTKCFTSYMENKNEKLIFIKAIEQIFNYYMNDIKEEILDNE